MFLPLLALALFAPASIQASATPAPVSPADPIESDWRPIPDNELLVMDLEGGRRVVIRLAPRQAPVHVANIRLLARDHWWDGLTIYRVQDNYVTQWGDKSETKPLPAGVIENPAPEYEFAPSPLVMPLTRTDPYARNTGITADGWPEARGAWRDDQASDRAWLTHCYGMVGVARDLAPSTGSGAELYVVIGHAPRHLDRNIALVGRVIEGMEYLSSLPRGHDALGLYTDDEKPTGIVRVRLAADLPDAERPRYDYRATDNPRFRAYLFERENRSPPFFTVPAGGADVCNIPLQVRVRPKD